KPPSFPFPLLGLLSPPPPPPDQIASNRPLLAVFAGKEKMEPGQSGTEQASPRGNDWEVVQLTASAYAAAPAPRKPEPSDEAEAKRYGAKGDDLAAGLLMSGHFSVSQSEVESLLVGADTKEPPPKDKEEPCEHTKLLEDDVPTIPFDDGKALKGMGLVGEEPAGFSSPVYSSITESRSDKRSEEPTTLHSFNPVTGSTKVVSPDEQSEPAAGSGSGSGSGPREAWWKKQLLSLYRNAKESKHLWPIVATTAALVGLAYLGRRWHKGRLQFQLLKISPSTNKE
ncbi:hypothetical protein ACJX0J_021414, partial [Zea mays]